MTISGLTMVSRVLGLGREIMIAAFLGSGPVAEAFFVAFRLPNLFRRFFAEGAFSMAFVPIFAKMLEGDGRRAARNFAEDALSGLLAILVALTLAAQLATPWLVFVIAPGFADDPAKFDLAAAFTRVQFPYLLFISLVALYSGVLNSIGKFAAAAGAPILLNMAMILAIGGAALASEGAGPERQKLIGYCMSWAVFVAGVLQFLLVARSAARAGLILRLKVPVLTPDLSRLIKIGAPGAIAGGVQQINILIGTAIATWFAGAVAWLTYADRIYQLPLGVVGIAIGVALLPALSRRIRAGDPAGANHALNRAVELSFAFSMPAAVALIVIPDEIVRLLFGRGQFSEADVRATGAALALYSSGLPAYILAKALSPAYFAAEDTRTPLRYAVWSMATNTALSIGLAFFDFISWYSVPIATSAAAWLNVVLLWRGLREGDAYRADARLLARGAGVILASIAMGAALYFARETWSERLSDPFWRFPYVLLLVVGGMGLYGVAAIVTGALRPSELRAMLRRRKDDPTEATPERSSSAPDERSAKSDDATDDAASAASDKAKDDGEAPKKD
ncbi:MAG: murein biosynthesis integral membrane protein MurJ [Neomegalonema sp.]|nr:murein biosynthesis integral membrane protein MurJ [Neomegalonema sp.]